MKAIVKGIVALAALGWAGAAQADWEFTRWGMSVDELIDASGGSASSARDTEDTRIWDQRRLATGPVTYNGIAYEAAYYFDKRSKRLTLIDMEPDVSQCDAVLADHSRRLGKGETVRTVLDETEKVSLVLSVTDWRDARTGQQVRYLETTIPPSDFRYCKVMVMERDLSPK